jgi:hypothetical protein
MEFTLKPESTVKDKVTAASTGLHKSAVAKLVTKKTKKDGRAVQVSVEGRAMRM